MWAAIEAQVIGYGGVAMVARATGLTRDTVTAGLKELEDGAPLPVNRVRQTGGGRRRLTDTIKPLNGSGHASEKRCMIGWSRGEPVAGKYRDRPDNEKKPTLWERRNR